MERIATVAGLVVGVAAGAAAASVQAATFPPAGAEMAWVPAGEYAMGCAAGDTACYPEEKPRHAVTLSHGFWLSVTEVTVGQFRAYAKATGAAVPPQPVGSRDNYPVVGLTWGDAAGYCAWAGDRLPTEAEWEAAARGGLADAIYPWGSDPSHDRANFAGVEGRDRWTGLAPVASFDPNSFGLFDMAGNVWEWCADWYSATAYTDTAGTDPTGPASGTHRVLRGGSFNYGARSMRVSDRGRLAPTGRGDFVGFRCARDGPGPAAPAPSPSAAATPESPAPPSPAPPATPVAVAPAATAPAPAAAPSAGEGAAAAAVGRPAGTRRSFPPASSELAWIPPATVEIGCVRGDGDCDGDEQPRHAVAFANGFWIDTSEVTVGQFRAYAAAAARTLPRQPEWADDSHPVVNVTWKDAADYCRWAGGRLPTEAEWEYAARGGRVGEKYVTGQRIDAGAVNADGVSGGDRFGKSAPVRSFAPNGFGLYDMAGNVWEWCADWYEPRAYAAEAAVDPTGPVSGSERVVRGGSWTSNPWRMRTSYRFRLAPVEANVTLGFRCVRDPGPQDGGAATRP